MSTSQKSIDQTALSQLKTNAQSQKIENQSIAKLSNHSSFHTSSKETPTSYNNRQDVKKNQVSVHIFYVQILKLYIQKIYYYQQRRERVSFLYEEDVERFNSAIRYFYNQSIDNYMKSLKRRESNSSVNLKLSQKSEYLSNIGDDISVKSKECEEKLENIESSQLYMSEFRFPSRQSTQFSYRPSSQKSPSQLPTLFLPIFSFSNINIPQSLTSKSTTYSYSSKKSQRSVSDQTPPFIKESQGQSQDYDEVKISEKEEEQGESDCESESSDYAQRAEAQVNCLFYGNFAINNIKRKPKEEKIYLELHNVFIKFADNGRDTFFDRASFELKKAEKTQVPLQKIEE